MSKVWTLSLPYRVSQDHLRPFLEKVLGQDLVSGAYSIAPSDGEPFSTDPVEHLLNDGAVHLETTRGWWALLTLGKVLGALRDRAARQAGMGTSVLTDLRELSHSECEEFLAAAVASPHNFANFYLIETDTAEVPTYFLDRPKAHKRFMALFQACGDRMTLDDWATADYAQFVDREGRYYNLCRMRFEDDQEELQTAGGSEHGWSGDA